MITLVNFIFIHTEGTGMEMGSGKKIYKFDDFFFRSMHSFERTLGLKGCVLLNMTNHFICRSDPDHVEQLRFWRGRRGGQGGAQQGGAGALPVAGGTRTSGPRHRCAAGLQQPRRHHAQSAGHPASRDQGTVEQTFYGITRILQYK